MSKCWRDHWHTAVWTVLAESLFARKQEVWIMWCQKTKVRFKGVIHILFVVLLLVLVQTVEAPGGSVCSLLLFMMCCVSVVGKAWTGQSVTHLHVGPCLHSWLTGCSAGMKISRQVPACCGTKHAQAWGHIFFSFLQQVSSQEVFPSCPCTRLRNTRGGLRWSLAAVTERWRKLQLYR